MSSYQVSTGVGLATVQAKAQYVGHDLAVLLTAGRVHIGAVALAVPVQGSAEGVTASCSVLTAPGHRDNLPAEQAALALCKALSCNVTVAAGLHIDHATKEQITTLVKNSAAVINKLIAILKED